LDRREPLGTDDAGNELHGSPGMNEKRPENAGAVMVFSRYERPGGVSRELPVNENSWCVLPSHLANDARG
ncbi:MAG: hypothetical protein M3Y05_00855, partial [Gemmatimonadota bacterium]|nr:hypothetical protein [Gemmatimonadota bacterium]